MGGEPGGCCRVASPMGDGCVAISKVASLLSGLSKEKPLLAAQAALCPASRPAPRASAALCSGHASALALALGTLGHQYNQYQDCCPAACGAVLLSTFPLPQPLACKMSRGSALAVFGISSSASPLMFL